MSMTGGGRLLYTGRMECRLCGAVTAPFIAAPRPYAECPSCGYLQLDEACLPSPERERSRYLLHRNDPADPGYRGWMERFIDSAVLPWARPGGRALDYGSGPEPLMTRLLADRGFEARAWDPYFAPDQSWREGGWDLVVMHEVAEHLAFPGRAFRELAPLLAPGAAVCVRTRFPPADRAAFASWWYREDITHVGFFPKRSLELAWSALGFRALWDDGIDSVTFGERSGEIRG